MNAPLYNGTHDPETVASLHMNTGLLVMQYSYTLPADYDMSIIRQRIATKGHLIDNFPNLALKAFTFAASDYNERYSRENLYAPVYLWQSPEGINRFFESRGFAALVQAFGWPRVRIWSVWSAQLRDSFPTASWATQEHIAIAPFSELEHLQQQEADKVATDIHNKRALGAFTAFDPGDWTLVRFRLWRTCPHVQAEPNAQVYQVGYLATGVTKQSDETSLK